MENLDWLEWSPVRNIDEPLVSSEGDGKLAFTSN
jgi:hypothetical protein